MRTHSRLLLAMIAAPLISVPAAGAIDRTIGLNWMTQQTGQTTVIWHNGGTGGYRTFLGLDPKHSTAVVIMTNSNGAGADDIGMHLLDASFPLTPKPPAKP